MENLDKITKTIAGYPVKNLRWREQDNIITGNVQCPKTGKASFNDGYVSGAWRRNGTPTNSIKGREDLKLDLVISE